MSMTSDLLHRIVDHCSRAGIAETTFGRRAANDGKIVPRLRAGKTITLKTLQRIEVALAEGASSSGASPLRTAIGEKGGDLASAFRSPLEPPPESEAA